MPQFNGSTIVEASAEDVWYLLDDIPEIAAGLNGVEHVELLPHGEPLDIDSQLRIKTTKLSRLVVAHIIDIDDDAFALETHVTGPGGISGDVIAQLHPLDENRSRLAVEGALKGNLATNWIVSIGLATFADEGIHQIGQKVSAHAQRERERVR